MAQPIIGAPSKIRTRLIYDVKQNVIQIREYSIHAKLGQKVVTITDLTYDATSNIIKIFPTSQSDAVVADDLS